MELESSVSPRLQIDTASDGSRLVRFRQGGQWFVVLFLGVWLCGWAAGEIAAVSTLASGATGDGTGFTGIWLVLWTIGGAFAGGALLWMLFGSETVEANLVALTHNYRIFGFSRTRAFGASEVTNLRLDERTGRRGSVWRSMAFDYGTRTIRVFHQIDSADAAAAITAIERALGRRRDE